MYMFLEPSDDYLWDRSQEKLREQAWDSMAVNGFAESKIDTLTAQLLILLNGYLARPTPRKDKYWKRQSSSLYFALPEEFRIIVTMTEVKLAPKVRKFHSNKQNCFEKDKQERKKMVM